MFLSVGYAGEMIGDPHALPEVLEAIALDLEPDQERRVVAAWSVRAGGSFLLDGAAAEARHNSTDDSDRFMAWSLYGIIIV